MNRVSRSICKRVLAAALAMALGATIAAAKPPQPSAGGAPAKQAPAAPAAPAKPAPATPADKKTPAKTKSKAADDAANLALLKQAYMLLAPGDHDYKGHRRKAMRAIEAACIVMGSDISGNGPGKESQTASDAQLRQALALLEKVESAVAADKENKVLTHVKAAINQINAALATQAKAAKS